MPSSNASSDWDFTAVIDLLHTPTRPPSGSRRDESNYTTLSNRHGLKKELPGSSRAPQNNPGEHGLGDFTRLWDFLHPSTVITEPLDNNASTTNLLASGCAPLSSSKPISILKRDVHTTSTTPGQANSAGILSDSATGESDGDLSVFDSVVSHNPKALSFIPSQVKLGGRALAALTPPSSCEEESTLLSSIPKKILKPPTKDKAVPRYKSAVERKAGLVLKLGKQFPGFSASSGSKHPKPSSSAVHVFVDLSNISIGLHDSYKIQHDIPVSTHIKRLPLSFQNFSLILERGRPVAKRVLAGSDRFAAINEAEKLGYEVNILSRVHKAKEYTPRQQKFRNLALAPPEKKSSETGSSSSSSFPAERWVEQCVDEILHLKILESLVDTQEPATIVLATGDAAEAEFSGGFLRMVERALQKGWSIELVSFAMNTSFAYKRKEFRAKWGARFSMINLEDYVEEMLDM